MIASAGVIRISRVIRMVGGIPVASGMAGERSMPGGIHICNRRDRHCRSHPQYRSDRHCRGDSHVKNAPQNRSDLHNRRDPQSRSYPQLRDDRHERSAKQEAFTCTTGRIRVARRFPTAEDTRIAVGIAKRFAF